jgi:hypothetical protein
MNNIWKTGRIALGLGWAEVVFGAWLIVSPFVLGLSQKSAITNNIITGIILILLTLVSRINGLLRLFIILLGGWLYASAFALDSSGPARVAYLANGLVLAILVIITAVASERPYPHNYRPPASRR